MELEGVARWFCCREKLSQRPANESGRAAGQPPAAEQVSRCYLCPDYQPGGEQGNAGRLGRCWQATCNALLEIVNRILADTFRDVKDATDVTVVDWLRSFSPHYERPTLRVEVTSPRAIKPYIVKFALEFPPDRGAPAGSAEASTPTPAAMTAKTLRRLQDELNGYQLLCDDESGGLGPVFAALTLGLQSTRGAESVKYSDAEQTLRAGEAVTSLERAILDACVGNKPSLDSVEATIVQLFAALEDKLYRHSWSQDNVFPEYLIKQLREGRDAWLSSKPRTEAYGARNDVLWALRDPDLQFIDPAMYFNDKKFPRVPEMVVGTAHGDLHGRNVLVGVVEGEARWPIVFDYEDVTCCNLVGWDFVKLEMELKKIGLAEPAILSARDDADFLRQLYEFEQQLNVQTEACYNHNNWAAAFPGWNNPLARLGQVVLTIRRMAWKYLERARRRSRKWLHEYYFLLAAYGVQAARYRVFREARPLKTLLIGAGVAAYRHAYGEDLGQQAVEISKIDAQDWMARAGSADRCPETPERWGDGDPADDSANVPGRFSYIVAHASAPAASDGTAARPSLAPWSGDRIGDHRYQLANAGQLARSRKLECIELAVGRLRELMEQHPFLIDPAHECALALLESALLAKNDQERRRLWDETDRLLKRAVIRFRGQMHEELLSRRGRLKKDQADYWSKLDPPRAGTLYKEAAEAYGEATLVTGEKYYPAINEATCLWLSGDHENSRKKANELLQLLDPDSQSLWVLATRGEALVIAGCDNWRPEAETAYQGALELARKEGRPKHESETMIRQLERIKDRMANSPRASHASQLDDLIGKLRRLVDPGT
jgi:hypothetical protein